MGSKLVEVYRGVKVYSSNRINMRVTTGEFKQFIDAKLDFNMTVRDAIKHKKALCNVCNGIEIIKHHKK